MKILMLVNWKIHYLNTDNIAIQPPDKVVKGTPYWIFKYWPENVIVDVVDYSKLPLFHALEKEILKFYAWQAIVAAFKSRNYDMIISHGAQSGILLAFLRALCGNRNPPHFIIDIGCFNGARENLFETMPIEFASRTLAGIIYHSSIQRKYYQRHFPTIVKRTIFVPFGVDVEFFAPGNGEIDDVVVSFGYQKRDYETLLKAWRGLKGVKTELRIIGIKNSGICSLKNNSGDIKFFDFVPISELKRIIAASRFVVIPLPYFEYCYGQMSLLQSMSMGKAVIVTKTPSTQDYVVNGRNGFFVDPYDVNGLHGKLEFLLKNPNSAKDIGDRAHRDVREKFSEELMTRRIYNFLKVFK
ncbi:MAG: hypothetical protein A2Y62_08355 [Candidatus Fischerbacteria bacterium RBG_13_37_8]|uniref:Glycosyl transferase family 1 domain-containing protein n=1 Tax=Candidatus Fischerbacteria bacterium RBG_13_37_8 TaxID=1817863 RepID=A0A1F5VXJ7_9BACT|nr:MAG: hypothetical protein A2Y62_08355 [Candidatus Fischerbacteria bacterium RBG_13_37_8]